MKPSRPKKVARKAPKKVAQPKTETNTEDATVTKYSPQPKIGEPTIGIDPDIVTRVGLGNLEVIDIGKQTYTT